MIITLGLQFNLDGHLNRETIKRGMMSVGWKRKKGDSSPLAVLYGEAASWSRIMDDFR